MTWRLLGPIGGPIVFFLVAALVFGGLGWVTHSAIGVEQAQREAAARAELGNNLRVALWRLDGRMLPALGVEDSRPYFHYSPPDPASTPLLVATLPDWMKLHFQLDPTQGWCSPQVLDTTTADRVREAWEGVAPQNLSSSRAATLAGLKARCPVEETLARFAATDRAIPADSLSLAAPFLIGEGFAPPETATLDPKLPISPAKPAPGASSQLPSTVQRADVETYRLFGWELCPRTDAFNNALRDKDSYQQSNSQKKLGESNTIQNSSGQYYNFNRGGGRMVQQDVDNRKEVGDWMSRAGVIDRAFREAKQAAEHQLPKGQQSVLGNNYQLLDPRNTINPGAGSPAGPGLPPADEKAKELKELMASKVRSGRSEVSETEKLRLVLGRETARHSKEIAEWFARPIPYMVRRAQVLSQPEPTTAPAQSTVPPPGEERAMPTQPMAIHLGSMRPHWVAAPDGTDMLVLVRSAVIDGKTVYQGVVIDWEKLETALKDEVKDLFPDAKLVPVKDTSAVFPDRAMTALPVQLDPGPETALAPAGWTPLRLGLALSWAAAIIAFTAVGFAGWSLIDLAERRIRFVSAVTHELRTPLTSLRLYLDLLVSGMIQDEKKRQEYLSTLAIESDRLHRLVDNVLDFARLEKRKKNGDIRDVPVNDIAEQLRQTWTERVAQDGKELLVVSTVPTGHVVKTDPAMILQIIGNLVDNARKYSRDSADKRIWVWVKPGPGNGVIFEVEDRGPGVPASERRSIFKPFRRGAQAETTGGAGLGLALAKSWAEVLGAKLAYRPAEGGTGACFRLELPAA